MAERLDLEDGGRLLERLALTGLADWEVLSSSARSRVLRMRGARTVILKQAVDRDEVAFAKFANEVATLEYLAGLAVAGRRVAPELLDFDRDALIVAMTDASPGDSLEQLLLAGRGDDAQAGLIAWASTLGAINGMSLDTIARFEARRAQLGPADLARPNAPPVVTLIADYVLAVTTAI